MAKNWTFLQDKQCTDSERVFAGSGLDFKPKYFAGFGKTQNCFWWNTVFDRFLGKRDSPANIGTGYVIGKENGIRDSHFRSSGRGIVIEGRANTGSGPNPHHPPHPTPLFFQALQSVYKRTTASTSLTTFSVPRHLFTVSCLLCLTT